MSILPSQNGSLENDALLDLLDTLEELVGRYPAIALELQACHDSIALLMYEGRRRDHREILLIAAVGIGAQRYSEILRETNIAAPTAARLLKHLVDEAVLGVTYAQSGPLYTIQRHPRPRSSSHRRRGSL